MKVTFRRNEEVIEISYDVFDGVLHICKNGGNVEYKDIEEFSEYVERLFMQGFERVA